MNFYSFVPKFLNCTKGIWESRMFITSGLSLGLEVWVGEKWDDTTDEVRLKDQLALEKEDSRVVDKEIII